MEPLNNREEQAAQAAAIAQKAGVALDECYQCGKCSAGCPMAHAMDLMPRQIVHCLRTGQTDLVLRSKAIWLCATCHTCVERCPHSIDIPSLVEVSRQAAERQGICAVQEVGKFNNIFMENIRVFGKSQEVILEGLYNVTSGHFLQDMDNAPRMALKGMIRPELQTVRNKSHVRDLLAAAEEEDRK